MVTAFFASTHSIERLPSTSSSHTKGSSEGGGDDGCCAAVGTRKRGEIASRRKRVFMFIKLPPQVLVRQSFWPYRHRGRRLASPRHECHPPAREGCWRCVDRAAGAGLNSGRRTSQRHHHGWRRHPSGIRSGVWGRQNSARRGVVARE